MWVQCAAAVEDRDDRELLGTRPPLLAHQLDAVGLQPAGLPALELVAVVPHVERHETIQNRGMTLIRREPPIHEEHSVTTYLPHPASPSPCGNVTDGRARYAVVGVVLTASALTSVFATTVPGSARVGARPSRAPTRTTTVAPDPRFWADTVQIDGIDGGTLSVHSVRHPELAQYTVQADQNTIFQRVPGSLFAAQPGLEVGGRFYFTGTSLTGVTPPSSVRALRIFP